MTTTSDPSTPDRIGLRERKKRRTKAQLSDAALRLFSERGFDEVTIEEIAATVEVSPRTFFRYFASKEDVLFVDMDSTLTAIREALVNRPVEEPATVALREAVLSIAEGYELDPGDALERATIMAQTPSLLAHGVGRQAAWEEAIAETLAERKGDAGAPDLRDRLLSACAIAALRVAFAVWVDGGGTGSLIDLARGSLGLLESGFADGSDSP